jgi:hypothetical protein
MIDLFIGDGQPVHVPRRFGSYEYTQTIGSGGSSIVVLAAHVVGWAPGDKNRSVCFKGCLMLSLEQGGVDSLVRGSQQDLAFAQPSRLFSITTNQRHFSILMQMFSPQRDSKPRGQ